MNDNEDQFKDFLFINKLNIPQQTRSLHSSIPKLKISRSTWTKKVVRQKQNQQKLKSFRNIFQSSRSHHISQFRQVMDQKYKKLGLQITVSSKSSVSHHKAFTNNIKINGDPSSNTHFVVNRNVFNGSSHEDLTKSGILLQKIEDEECIPSIVNKKSKDQRLFLKNLKIKSNVNLYKGNFSKFTKKEIIQTVKSKRFHLTNDIDLSPWGHDTNRHIPI